MYNLNDVRLRSEALDFLPVPYSSYTAQSSTAPNGCLQITLSVRHTLHSYTNVHLTRYTLFCVLVLVLVAS